MGGKGKGRKGERGGEGKERKGNVKEIRWKATL